MSYTHLWLDVVAGLKTQGWEDMGGNFTCWRMMKKEGKEIKVFLSDYKKLHEDDINFVIIRYSSHKVNSMVYLNKGE